MQKRTMQTTARQTTARQTTARQKTLRTGSLLSLATLAALGLAARPAAAQLVTNGGFESGDFTGWTLNDPSNSTAVIYNGFHSPNGHTYYSHSGGYEALLGATGNDGTLSQNIVTTVGDSYTFSYYLASDGLTPNDFSASFGGTTVTGPTTDIPAQGYTLYSFTDVATAASSAISFTERNDNGFLSLDDVSVTDNGPAATPAPEPSSVAAFAFTGLGAAGLILRARRRRAVA